MAMVDSPVGLISHGCLRSPGNFNFTEMCEYFVLFVTAEPRLARNVCKLRVDLDRDRLRTSNR